MSHIFKIVEEDEKILLKILEHKIFRPECPPFCDTFYGTFSCSDPAVRYNEMSLKEESGSLELPKNGLVKQDRRFFQMHTSEMILFLCLLAKSNLQTTK